MVGEIRDEETARMAIQSSLTGHLVFSTLHTNNAAGAVSRLLDLGIEPYLVASSLLASLAQRLIRRVCPSCCKTSRVSLEETRLLQLDVSLVGTEIVSAGSCDQCGMTGYRGRQGVFELMSVDDEIQELISQRSKSSAIQEAALRRGMTSLRADAIRKLFERQTTVDEVSRVTQSDGWSDLESVGGPDLAHTIETLMPMSPPPDN
jgi:general secretion pathway protein E